MAPRLILRRYFKIMSMILHIDAPFRTHLCLYFWRLWQGHFHVEGKKKKKQREQALRSRIPKTKFTGNDKPFTQPSVVLAPTFGGYRLEEEGFRSFWSEWEAGARRGCSHRPPQHLGGRSRWLSVSLRPACSIVVSPVLLGLCGETPSQNNNNHRRNWKLHDTL